MNRAVKKVKWITVQDAIEVCTKKYKTVSNVTIHNWIEKYKFGRKMGGRWLINESAFLMFLDDMPAYKKVLEETRSSNV